MKNIAKKIALGSIGLVCFYELFNFAGNWGKGQMLGILVKYGKVDSDAIEELDDGKYPLHLICNVARLNGIKKTASEVTQNEKTL